MPTVPIPRFFPAAQSLVTDAAEPDSPGNTMFIFHFQGDPS